ncbi:hypothetical protein CRE_02051 [Caenorhabditis remanei]|uniref:Uncharacterized protein n=1 Tax=Caenorhabditis remanei TaxID=31234 RepID=E3LH11_CAERE|nr:hypothetical protein CRE_02051 [Caenorhabditis remanei]
MSSTTSSCPSMEFYFFNYFPRNRRLSSYEKAFFDEYSRYMAQMMIEKQEDFKYWRSVESSSAASPIYSSDSGYSSSRTSGVTTPVNLVKNPFYDPEYVKQHQSTPSGSPPSKPVKLIANPFYNPALVKQMMSQ